jgi:hypothetical protein
MKIISIILLLLPIIGQSQEQDKPLRFKATGKKVSTNKKDWSDANDSDVLIIYNNSRVVIYESETKTYEVIKYRRDQYTDEEGIKKQITVMKCRNSENSKCTMVLIKEVEGAPYFLAIFYKDIQFAYLIKPLD